MTVKILPIVSLRGSPRPPDDGARAVKIVTICGAGIGSSAILKVNTERVLRRLDLDAEVVAADLASVAEVAADAQVILTSQQFADLLPKTFADVIVIENYFDTAELTTKLQAALS